MKRLIVICAALFVALAVPTTATVAVAAPAAPSAVAAKKDKKKSKRAKPSKTATKKSTTKDAVTLRAEQRCRAEKARLGAAFQKAWGGSKATAMKRCVAQLKQDEIDAQDDTAADEDVADDEGLEGLDEDVAVEDVDGEVVEGDDAVAVDDLDAGDAVE